MLYVKYQDQPTFPSRTCIPRLHILCSYIARIDSKGFQVEKKSISSQHKNPENSSNYPMDKYLIDYRDIRSWEDQRIPSEKKNISSLYKNPKTLRPDTSKVSERTKVLQFRRRVFPVCIKMQKPSNFLLVFKIQLCPRARVFNGDTLVSLSARNLHRVPCFHVSITHRIIT